MTTRFLEIVPYASGDCVYTSSREQTRGNLNARGAVAQQISGLPVDSMEAEAAPVGSPRQSPSQGLPRRSPRRASPVLERVSSSETSAQQGNSGQSRRRGRPSVSGTQTVLWGREINKRKPSIRA
eukprot:3063595-Pleurochrysis_carterae.AAC.1